MKKSFIRLGEAVCVLLLVVFIAFISSQDKISEAPFDDVRNAVESACDLNELKSRSKLDVKKKFSFDTDSLEGFVYYSSDSVMDVRELFVIRATDSSVAKNVIEAIENYAEEKENLFDGYAPKESELIASRVLLNKRGYILFYIGQEKEKVVSAFSESL